MCVYLLGSKCNNYNCSAHTKICCFKYHFRCIYYIAFSFLAASIEVYMLLFICFICGPLIPMIRSFLANSVPPHMKSKVQATFGALQTVVMLLANVLVAIHSETVDQLPGLTYWIISFICFCGAASAGCVIFFDSVRRNIPDLNGHLPAELMGLDAASEPLLLEEEARTMDTETEALVMKGDDKIKQIDKMTSVDAAAEVSQKLGSSADLKQRLIGENSSALTRETIPALFRKRMKS